MKIEKEQMKQWVENWKTKGKILGKMRIDEIRQRKTSETMLALVDAFEFSIANYSIPKTSGLVEQQKWFMILQKNASVN